MQLALARPVNWRWIGRWFVLIVAGTPFLAWNVWQITETWHLIAVRDYVYDWWVFETAVERISSGTMYERGEIGQYDDVYGFRYSPLFAYAIAPFIDMGLAVWRVLHFAVLVLLPWRVALVVVLTFPFWYDVAWANMLTFAFVAAFLAVRGSNVAALAFFALTILVPRPLMLPVAAWLLWKRPGLRWPAVLMAVAGGMLTVMTGESAAFVAALVESRDGIDLWPNWGPSRIVGAWWLIIGLPLGAWLTAKGRLGLATLATTPYIFPYHWIFGALELRTVGLARPRACRGAVGGVGHRAAR